MGRLHNPGTILPLPGPVRLSRAEVAESQRRRLLQAMIDSVATHGYAAASVSDVVAAAGVSRRTFYEQFSDKEECFLACIDLGAETLLSAISITSDSKVTVLERLDGVLGTYLDLLAGEPAFAKAYLVETMTAGTRAMACRRELLGRFIAFLESLHQQGLEEGAVPQGWAPDLELVAAAISATVTMRVAAGETRQLVELRDRLALFVMSSMGAPGAFAATSRSRGHADDLCTASES